MARCWAKAWACWCSSAWRRPSGTATGSGLSSRVWARPVTAALWGCWLPAGKARNWRCAALTKPPAWIPPPSSTARPVGDAVEVEALNRVFGERSAALPDCALGSVKSMISHTMPASGAAGLIKTALALHHKVLPATLHCETPNPKLDLAKSRLYLNTETRPWIHGTGPRRAGVNAFGFGGINAHTVLEEYTGPNQAPWLQHRWECELFVLSAPARPELLAEAERLLHLAAALPDDVPL